MNHGSGLLTEAVASSSSCSLVVPSTFVVVWPWDPGLRA